MPTFDPNYIIICNADLFLTVPQLTFDDVVKYGGVYGEEAALTSLQVCQSCGDVQC